MNYIVIRGPLGIGKTTIASKLAEELNGIHISIDKVLEENNLDKVNSDYVFQDFIKVNEIALIEAEKYFKRGKVVIFDGNFYFKNVIDDLVGKLEDLGYNGAVFTLKASLDECIKRDSKRKRAYGIDAAKAVYGLVSKFDYGTVINTNNKNADDVVNKIKEQLA